MNVSFLRRWAIGFGAAGVVFVVGQGSTFVSLYAAFVIVLLIGLLNASLPYVLSMMTGMQNILTLGLTTLIINTFVLYILQEAHLGIRFASFNSLVLIAIMISTIAWFSTLAMDTSLQTKH